ncbi:uncharacterized protein LOC121737550 [Aricia agestis]|uniref:uncharacterized protein LOC121730138 n=1 Tax=Aricia agestis TaxID=91739 RepID=UPI001C2090AF|nr:uncharacterized protein LOC121730138 [Aricia agestis]XP_041978127.1 uncharacterized protein LOC121732340 [Aricia agestis]XP_041985137.1 uncharacterized protein LOC121737550 [Aricia agestis]
MSESRDSASRKRKSSRSRESTDSSSTSSSSERGVDLDPRGNVRFRSVSKRSRHVSNEQFEHLSQQVSYLTNLIMCSNSDTRVRDSDINVTGDSSKNNPASVSNNLLELQPPQRPVQDLKLSDLSTTVKDPLFPKSSDEHFKRIFDLQRFKSSDWNCIRFSDAQKKYASVPGFIEMNVNDELRRFAPSVTDERSSRFYLTERSFAAISNAILKQKDELRNNLQSLINWARDNEQYLTATSLFEKIEQLFSKDSGYTKVSDDILQIVCGRRADLINVRREAVLRQIPEEYHSSALQKIPPDGEFLFDKDILSSYLQKVGGADKLTPTAGPSTQNRYTGLSAPAHHSATISNHKQSDMFFRSSYNKPKPNNRKSKQPPNRRSNYKNKRNSRNKPRPKARSPSNRYQ